MDLLCGKLGICRNAASCRKLCQSPGAGPQRPNACRQDFLFPASPPDHIGDCDPYSFAQKRPKGYPGGEERLMRKIKTSSLAIVAVVSVILNLVMFQELRITPVAVSSTMQYEFDKLPFGMYQVSDVYTDGSAKLRLLRGAHGGYSVELFTRSIPTSAAYPGASFDILGPGQYSAGSRGWSS